MITPELLFFLTDEERSIFENDNNLPAEKTLNDYWATKLAEARQLCVGWESGVVAAEIARDSWRLSWEQGNEAFNKCNYALQKAVEALKTFEYHWQPPIEGHESWPMHIESSKVEEALAANDEYEKSIQKEEPAHDPSRITVRRDSEALLQ